MTSNAMLGQLLFGFPLINMWIILILSVIIAYAVHALLLKPLKVWKKKGVKHDPPTLFFGNIADSVFQRKSFSEISQNVYNKFQDERYCGFYQFNLPILMIRDPELIKQLGVKESDKFQDHQIFSREDIDPLWSKNLFCCKGEKWRSLRPAMSPSFTSSKMKSMFTLVTDCADQFTNYFLSQNEDVITVEMKDTFTRYANDVIATCAFGVTCDSLKERDNEFYRKGVEATDFGGLKGFKFFGFVISPRLMTLLNVKIISDSTGNFFRKLIGDSIKIRQEQGISRPDIIHLLLEARRQSKDNVIATNDDITAQALIFFLAGFDTSSTLAVYLSYELAVNKDIQDKLKCEIDATLKENNGKISYEALMRMKYLDMVINETLRKWPPNPRTDRLCNTEYTIMPEKPNEAPLVIEKGTTIWFPIFAILRDPKHFKDPMKFDPERFSDENKDKINPYTNLAFGVGPRICIGSRFALMETKAIIVKMLEHFEIVPVAKTEIPATLSKRHFTLHPNNGMWLGLKRRINNNLKDSSTDCY